MFSFFSKLFTVEQQELLNDKFIIKVNDYTYDIPNEKSFNSLKDTFTSYVFSNQLENANSSDIKYTITFINNDNQKLLISVTKREYIVELLDLINKSVLPKKMESLSIH